MQEPSETPEITCTSYRTRGGVTVRRATRVVDGAAAIADCVDALDRRRGVVLSSGFEYPGRYTRWDVGFYDPPLLVDASGRSLDVPGPNRRGLVPFPAVPR